jgi:FAD/FMN-containing dehydrogenase
MSSTTTFDTAQLEALANEVSGTILRPGDEGYDDARRVHNGMIDRRPALIVRCRSAADAAAAIRFARAAGTEISVRGGGHNVGGLAVADGAVMVDLAEMKSATVDPEARTVAAQGGMTWGELNAATAEHGLAVTGGAVSTTGIAGLTLGGGLGWLMAKYGLAADNVVGVELVTADGEILDVTADSHPDLFWALRGGGGNFGVATTFRYRLHPLTMITGGLIIHPVDAAPELFRFYRDAVSDLPDDLTVFAAMVHAPDGSGAKLAGFAVFHTGSAEEAERDLEPFKTWGSPVMTEVGPMPYPVMNTLLVEAYPDGSLNYWMSSFTAGVSDGLVDAMVERFATVPSTMSGILLEHFHGAVTRVGVTDTAVPHRAQGWNMLISSVWTDPAATEENIRWTKDSHAAFSEHLEERRWLNYLTDDQGESAVRAAYGPNWDRLVEVKRRYDPDNVFHLNQNIAP